MSLDSPTRVVASLFALLACGIARAADAGGVTCAAHSDATTLVPLVELYTSEGCSSCPPADRWLSSRLGHDRASFLAFHVDYWDSIGWPDRFASPRFSARQRERVAAQAQQSVYTPQVMVGADVQADWHDPAAWANVLDSARGHGPGAALSLRLHRREAGWQAALGASAIGSPSGARVWLARYLDDRSTQVRNGENHGLTLHHDRAVAQLYGPWPLAAGKAVSESVALPAGDGRWGLVAFVQDGSGRVLQSLDLSATDCTARETPRTGTRL